ncbi:MAG: tryptophan--tRNA ligase [Chlamydiales bacterium]
MKKRIVTGDRPTGKLHLGHWVGSIQNRLALQEKYDCYFLIADLHTLTTKPLKNDIIKMRSDIREVVLDWLSCGIDPEKSTIYLQSAIPEVYEMNLIFEMLVSLNRLTGLPSIKEMARHADIPDERISFGLIGYPILQSADILLPRAHLVPVGKDNEAHIELARDIARRFNNYYGEVFPQPEVLLSETSTLIGTDGKGKMSKSAGNAIFLSDSRLEIEKKVRNIFTDTNRIHTHIAGKVEGNPLFLFHDAFNPHKDEVSDFKARYRAGKIGDLEIKERLMEELDRLLSPIRARREVYENQKGIVEKIIYQGTLKMREIAKETLKEMQSAMGLKGYWNKISRIARNV